MTFSIMTFGKTTFSIMAFSIMTFGKTTFSIMAFSIVTTTATFSTLALRKKPA